MILFRASALLRGSSTRHVAGVIRSRGHGASTFREELRHALFSCVRKIQLWTGALFFAGQYLSLCRISFNKSNGLASQLRTGKEPLLARCDNATQALRLDRDRETIQAKLTLNHPSKSVR